ncbi:MAG: TonB family protein [Deltaproteobacteria bacterium]|nr:TonB family protein [Deltaproteobacteria bacterium]
MKKSIYARAYLLQEGGNDSNSLILTFTVSLICHIIFFAAFVLIPDFTQHKKFFPSVVNVSLVTLPPQRQISGPGNQIEIKSDKQVTKRKKTVSKKSVKVDQKPPKAVSVTPKEKKVKISLKKKTFDSSKVIKNAIKQIEKKVEKTRREQLAETLERIKEKVEKTEAIERLKKKTEKDVTRQASRIPSEVGDAGTDKQIWDIMQIYKLEIAYQIQKNWAFSEQLAGMRNDLKALLVFKVMPDGEIRDVFFTDRSGNRYLDESAYKAIIKSNPVLPHPKGFIRPYVTVGIRFTPEGVK